MKKHTPVIIVSIVVMIFVFILVDFWTGKTVSTSGTVYDKEWTIINKMPYFSVEISTELEMGIPITIEISSGQYESLEIGQNVEVEVSYGGITGINYSNRLQ